MASRALIPFLVGMMLLTGVCNTLFMKYQDNQCVRNCDDPDVTKRVLFRQPVLQTAQMFVGEMGCWIVVGLLALRRRYARQSSPSERGYQAVNTDEAAAAAGADHRSGAIEDGEDANKPELDASLLRGFRVLLLSLPAVCDMCGTALMNAGLLLVAASIYQMTRGALVLFVGLFSVLFLKRRLHLFQWLSLVGVMLGVAIVGLAGAITPDKRVSSDSTIDEAAAAAVASNAALAVLGVVLIAGAQIFSAAQFVLEEWILERTPIEPIQMVGFEGIFGFLATAMIMLILHLTVGQTEEGRYGDFDVAEGLHQIATIQPLWVSGIFIMVSIGGFNFFGLSVTRSVSATARSTIDTCRTLFIWIVSLGLGWETFKWLQIVGFALLVYATFVFNGIVQPPLKSLRVEEEIEELLPEEPIESHR